jgi:prophage antirepressor-like protein
VYIRMVDGLPQPWFQAKPIVVHLGHSPGHVSMVVGKLPAKHRKSLGELVGVEQADCSILGHHDSIAIYLSEAGLFELLCKSEMPAARPFQDWVFEEVLPAIRRTGGYLHGQALPQLVSQAVAQALPQLVTQVVAQALPAIQQAILDCHSHHIFEASHGGASEEDQARLREIGRDAALEREAFLAEGPIELGAFLCEQLPAGQHGKVVRAQVRFAREAKARSTARKRKNWSSWIPHKYSCRISVRYAPQEAGLGVHTLFEERLTTRSAADRGLPAGTWIPPPVGEHARAESGGTRGDGRRAADRQHGHRAAHSGKRPAHRAGAGRRGRAAYRQPPTACTYSEGAHRRGPASSRVTQRCVGAHSADSTSGERACTRAANYPQVTPPPPAGPRA